MEIQPTWSSQTRPTSSGTSRPLPARRACSAMRAYQIARRTARASRHVRHSDRAWTVRLLALVRHGDGGPLPAADPEGRCGRGRRTGRRIPDEVVQITQVGGSLLSWAEKVCRRRKTSPTLATRSGCGIPCRHASSTLRASSARGALAPSELIVKIHDGRSARTRSPTRMESIDVGIARTGTRSTSAYTAISGALRSRAASTTTCTGTRTSGSPAPWSAPRSTTSFARSTSSSSDPGSSTTAGPAWTRPGSCRNASPGSRAEEKLQCDLEVYQAWNDMRNAEFEGMPERSKRPVWFSDHRLLNVTAMAMEAIQRSQSVLLWCRTTHSAKDW